MNAQIKTIVYLSPEEVGQAASDIFFKEVRTAEKLHKRLAFILPTGSTAVPMYKKIVERWLQEKNDLSQIIFFNMDEYVGLAKDDLNSYHAFMQSHFYQHMVNKENGPHSDNVHLPFGRSFAEAGSAAEDYGKKLRVYLDDPDTRVVCFGGIGRGPAHIAFNDFTSEMARIPLAQRQSYALSASTRVVALDEKTRQANRRFFAGDLAAVPSHAITIGFSEILQADHIIIMATDASKKEAVKSVFEGKPSYRTPASLLRLHAKKAVSFLLSKEAYGPAIQSPTVLTDLSLLKPDEPFGSRARLLSSTSNDSDLLETFDLKAFKNIVALDCSDEIISALSQYTANPLRWLDHLSFKDLQRFISKRAPDLLVTSYGILLEKPDIKSFLQSKKIGLLAYEDANTRRKMSDWFVLLSGEQLKAQNKALKHHISQIRRSSFADIPIVKAEESIEDLCEFKPAALGDDFAGAETYQFFKLRNGSFIRSLRSLQIFPHEKFPFQKQDQFILISPHPDDVEIGMGGLLQYLKAANLETHVFNVTGGDHADITAADALDHPSPHSELLAYLKEAKLAPTDSIEDDHYKRLVRQHESTSALQSLYPGVDVVSLNLPFYNHAYKFSNSDLQQALTALKPYFEASHGNQRGSLWVALPNWLDAHICHRTTTELFLKVLQEFSSRSSKTINILFYQTPWTGAANAYLDDENGLQSKAMVASERLLAKGGNGNVLLESGFLKAGKAIALTVYGF